MFTEELAKSEMEKVTKNYLDQIKIKRDELQQWWETPLNQLDISQTTCLISVLENLRMELGTQQSQNLKAIVPHEDFMFGGGNIDLIDQKGVFDVNAFINNSNTMVIPNDGPMFGSNDNNNALEVFNPIHNMNWPEFNNGQY
ncbi:unnamed protein product [Thlaspi arvense]|uniref:Uncharacterized protein n=1 Tax=Thlaspi arvense TaxID=13288 RepID=A0AAU9SA63_THLAR|nr:unnamed protein product [Thlaspi arvense]